MKKTLKSLSVLVLAFIMMFTLMAPAMANTIGGDPALIDKNRTGSITIYKYVTNAEGFDGTELSHDGTQQDPLPAGTTLANITFEIYKVAGLEYLNAAYPTTFDITGKTPVTEITTDGNGYAKAPNLELGLYYVVEVTNSAVRVPVAPFFVSVPMTNPNEDAWMYDVYVYPKNELVDGPDIDKDVEEIGNDHAGYDIGDDITWIILPEIPADIGQVGDPDNRVYTVTDTFDTMFTYVAGSVEVWAGGVQLDENADYTVDYTGRTLTVDFTADGMAKLATAYASKAANAYNFAKDGTASEPIKGYRYVEIYVDTTLNSSAELGVNHYNDAGLDYTNSADYTYDNKTVPPSKQPEAHTGGLVIHKVDGEGAHLPGAEFKLYRNYDSATGVLSDPVKVGSDDLVVTSDSKGRVVFTGLSYGDLGEDGQLPETSTTYYLVETKAPDTYNLLADPIPVTVHWKSHLAKNAGENGYTEGDYDTYTYDYEVVNRKGIVLPVTGGIGTTIFTVGGIALLVVAGVVLLGRKNKEEV